MPEAIAAPDETTSANHLPLEQVRWRLARIWLLGCCAIFLTLIGQSVLGAYGEETQRAWSWALPNLLPTLALMTSTFAADALKPIDLDSGLVRRTFASLASWLSVFYLAVFSLSLVLQPIAGHASSPAARLALLETSNLWLAPLQSIIVLIMGVLFFVKEPKTPT